MRDDVILEIFRMPNGEDDLYTFYPFLHQYRNAVDEGYKALSRRKEILSEKILIEKIFPKQNVKLLHNDAGMPLLSNGVNVSISHTRNHIAMMVSKHHKVALDIEHINDRVKKVARMFLRNDETFTTIEEMLVVWCVKETMYKLFSSLNLTFDEIYVRPFKIMPQGTLMAENKRTDEIIVLNYEITAEYVITTAAIPLKEE